MAETMAFKAAGVILHVLEKAERRTYDPSYTEMVEDQSIAGINVLVTTHAALLHLY